MTKKLRGIYLVNKLYTSYILKCRETKEVIGVRVGKEGERQLSYVAVPVFRRANGSRSQSFGGWQYGSISPAYNTTIAHFKFPEGSLGSFCKASPDYSSSKCQPQLTDDGLMELFHY